MDNFTGPDMILVKTALDKLFTGETLMLAREGKATALDPVVFTQDKAHNAAVVSSVQGGGGYFQVTTQDTPIIDQAKISASAMRTTLIANFNQNMPISRTFMQDQQISSVEKAVRQRAGAWVATRDRNAFNVFNLGFTTQTTIDGVALYSNSHVNQNGDTVDNLETGALTDSTLNIAVSSLRTQLGQDGTIAGYEPDYMLVPSILHQTGNAICKSVLRSGTGNNDVNYWSDIYPGMKVVYSPFLTTSTTAWFIGARNNGVMRFHSEEFNSTLVPWQFSANDEFQYKMRSREAVDSIYYNGTVGSNGTA